MSSRDSRPHSGSSRSRSDHDSRPHRDHKDKYRSEGERGPGGSRNDRDRQDGHMRDRSRSPNAQRDLSPHGIDDMSRRLDDTKDAKKAVPPPPPPPRISKISIGFTKPAAAPMKMSLGAGGGGGGAKSKQSVASVFNADSDDDEEMPAEARMRMRNIGRETPTSAGPNSFGKTKHGFCDSKKVFEKNMKQAMDSSGPKGQKPTPKFPQTVYKLSSS